MGKVIDWIKNNKLSTILIIIVGYFILQSGILSNVFYSTRIIEPSYEDQSTAYFGEKESFAGMMQSSPSYPITPSRKTAPSESKYRLVIKDTSLSMVVNNVEDSVSKIQKTAESLGGFLVNSDVRKPEGSATGSITIRVPSSKLGKALDTIKNYGVRVVNETVKGTDVTDKFEDLDARLATLEKTKAKFEELLEKAIEIEDILQVQRELISIQSQIDSIKGSQKYLTQSAKLSKIVIYLSTDELALPFTPDQPWKPKAVFKLAVRSLISNIQSIGSALIWITIYIPIWLPILLIILYIRRRGKK